MPYTAEQLEGRDIYIREGCYVCHSQMIRPFRAETERYGHYSLAGEAVYDHPFQFGSKRTGPGPRAGRRPVHQRVAPGAPPEPARPGARSPTCPGSRGWLKTAVDASLTPVKMQRLRAIGVPYTDADIAGAVRRRCRARPRWTC